MAVFPTEQMAERYARKICLKAVKEGRIPKEKFDECVTKVKSGYSEDIKNIDDQWFEGIMAKYGISPK